MQRIKQRLDLEEEFKYNRSRRRRWKEDAKLATTQYYQPEHVNGTEVCLNVNSHLTIYVSPDISIDKKYFGFLPSFNKQCQGLFFSYSGMRYS